MQAVILAGGASSRFHPLNEKPKSLIKIAGDPIIVHTVRSIKRAGINDIVLLTGPVNYFKDILGNGKKYGVKITYASIPVPTGMGDGLLRCAPFIKSDFFLLHAHHVEFDVLRKVIDQNRKALNEAIIIGKKSKTPKHYGVLKIEGSKVLGIVEKPKSMRGLSNLRIIGVYLLNQDFIKMLKKMKREHYSFENALDRYAKQGKVRVAISSQEVITLKYPWDVLRVKDFILEKLKRSISKKAIVAKSAKISENVVIEEGVQISDNAVIQGPCYIGRNSFIGTNALLRNSTDIEANVTIGAYMEVKNSLIMEDAKTHSGFVGDSVIGLNTRIGALFGTANVRLDRANIRVIVKNEKIDSGLRSLGVVIGENVVIGERVSTMPGVIIGNNANIGPSTTVMKNVDSDTIYYTRFKELVEKKSHLRQGYGGQARPKKYT
ncbi:MAG: NTP transferase domain-containing protein [Candidatus Levybacteria bacterium]|nr:NTP transferase domain-containing protein [Candidatus Levybacteria bacterium]